MIDETFSTATNLLTATDEIELARRMEAGSFAYEVLTGRSIPTSATNAELSRLVEEGRLARERFLLANLRLVAMVSNRAAWSSKLSSNDLFQEGVTGLITAVDRFDHVEGVRFATYALPWIRAAVFRAVSNRCGELNLSGARAERRRQLRSVWWKLTQELGRHATVSEVATTIGQGVAGVAELLELEPPVSLADDEGQHYDVPDRRAAQALEWVIDAPAPLLDWVRQLPAQERTVIEMRYGLEDDPVTYSGIGNLLGLSPTTVRRVEQRALDRLRNWGGGDRLLAG